MTEALKPCPFCGGSCEMWNANDGRPAWIACMGRCAVLISKEHKTDAEAIAAWNTRAIDPVLTDPRVKVLVDAATALRDQIAYWHDGGPAAGPDESKALFEALDAALRAIGGEA